MSYTTLDSVTASNAVRASWGNLVRSNQEDHESRIVDVEDGIADLEAGLVADGAVQFVEIALTSPELLALRATPKTCVAAPGAGKIARFLQAVLILDATATAYVESSANLAFRYTNSSGAKVSDDIEATGFIDQTTDTMTTARAKADAIVAKTGCENQPIVLHNIGAGEYTTGTGVMRAKVWYSVVTTGW